MARLIDQDTHKKRQEWRNGKMKFEFDTDKMIDGIVSATLEKEIDGKTLGQWMEEIKNFQWISVKDRMPESQTCVLVTVKTRNGKHVVLIACHVNAREINSEDYRWQDAELDWDYDEENDIYWVPECWYEDNFIEENTSWIIDEYADGIVTHWMPLPEPPKEE